LLYQHVLLKDWKAINEDKVASAISPAIFYKTNRSTILGSSPSQLRVAIYDMVSSKAFSRFSLLVVAMNTVFIIYEYFLRASECKNACMAGDETGT
jgi:hypothetical protein